MWGVLLSIGKVKWGLKVKLKKRLPAGKLFLLTVTQNKVFPEFGENAYYYSFHYPQTVLNTKKLLKRFFKLPGAMFLFESYFCKRWKTNKYSSSSFYYFFCKVWEVWRSLTLNFKYWNINLNFPSCPDTASSWCPWQTSSTPTASIVTPGSGSPTIQNKLEQFCLN